MISKAFRCNGYSAKEISLLSLFLVLLGCQQLVMNDSRDDLNGAFLIACATSNFSEMEKLLKEGANINSVDEERKLSALSYAAYSGNIEVARFLIHHRANIEGNSRYSNYPIYFAILDNHLDIVNLFLDNGMDPNYSWGKGKGTLLTNAVQLGHLEIVKLLVRRGADVNFRADKDSSPLFLAVILGKVEIMEYLLKEGAKLNEEDKSALEDFKWFENPTNETILSILKSNGAI